MSDPVFVLDAQGTPLMPMAPAYARTLLQMGKARWYTHHAFAVVQLARTVSHPALRPVLLGIILHHETAECLVFAEGKDAVFPLLHSVVDGRTDLPWRMRRRAAHRRRRKRRGRYRTPRRYGVPFRERRPSLARSQWRTQRRRSRALRVRTGPPHIPATVRWRALAIIRVIRALQRLLPISDVWLLTAHHGPVLAAPLSPAERRQHLIDMYGQMVAGKRRAICMYCDTTHGTIQVDHVVSRSRGGTDNWSNLVLACATCNVRKGDRTPTEAGISLRVQPQVASAPPHRIHAARRWTARLVLATLRQTTAGTLRLWTAHEQQVVAQHMPALYAAMMTALHGPRKPTLVAKPIARPPKQVYMAHNYPLATPLRPGWERVQHTIKQRRITNQAVAITRRGTRTVVTVVPATSPLPDDVDMLVRRGMLCEAHRATRTLRGIVGAIESNGRVRLLLPKSVRPERVQWDRVLVSARKLTRILSTDPVIFLRAPRDATTPVAE